MDYRCFRYSVCVVSTLVTVGWWASAVTLVQAQIPAEGSAPFLTSWGDPDFQGIWDNRTITPLERPQEFSNKAVLTAEEAAVYEAAIAERRVDDRSHWDRGTRVVEDRRTSLVIDPSNGAIPAMTAEGQSRLDFSREQGVNGPEERNPSERCITRSVPRLPGLYNNNFQVFQSPGYVVILMEMIHHARIIPLDGRPPLMSHVRQWNGDSRGHWEGQTLVVETTNFNGGTKFRGSAENLDLVERFTRVDADTIDYRFTVDDRTTWTQSWTARIPLNRNEGPLYEYACHERNDGMTGILEVNRNVERGTPAVAATKSTLRRQRKHEQVAPKARAEFRCQTEVDRCADAGIDRHVLASVDGVADRIADNR